jgi:hypothetical protein
MKKKIARMKSTPRPNNWCKALDSKSRAYVNQLIAEWPFRMFEIRDGFLYLLINHHTYLNFRDSKVVKLARLNGEEGYHYQTETI